MIDACVEYARTDTHTLIPFPTVVARAAAMMYSLITFHPFADGNKRTSLIVASYFFFVNGYLFAIPDDAPEFTKGVAARCLDNADHEPIEEITRIMTWLRPNIHQNFYRRTFYYLTRKKDKNALSLLIWFIAFLIWSQTITPHIGRLMK